MAWSSSTTLGHPRRYPFKYHNVRIWPRFICHSVRVRINRTLDFGNNLGSILVCRALHGFRDFGNELSAQSLSRNLQLIQGSKDLAFEAVGDKIGFGGNHVINDNANIVNESLDVANKAQDIDKTQRVESADCGGAVADHGDEHVGSGFDVGAGDLAGDVFTDKAVNDGDLVGDGEQYIFVLGDIALLFGDRRREDADGKTKREEDGSKLHLG